MNTDIQILPILDPQLMPARDEDGYCYHPHLDNLLADGEDGDDLPLDRTKLRAAGYEAAYAFLHEQQDDGDAAYDAYYNKVQPGGGCSDWTPDAPQIGGAKPGEWRLVAIYDTEDGPCSMWVKPLAAPMAVAA